jgi:hypothetical protein
MPAPARPKDVPARDLEKECPMRGRYPSGPEFVDKLDGSAQAKGRLKALLETLAGSCRVGQACDRLGLSEPRFDQIRIAALQAALAALEPQPAGRRPRQALADADEVQGLRDRVAQLEGELQAALVRAEIAVALPRVHAGAGKKRTRRPPPARRRS